MARKSKKEETKIDFNRLYQEASDEQIIQVLKKRKHYQKEAADAAIQEAIKREIIYSEQDLLAEKFRDEPLKFSLFPTIENQESRNKMRKSLTRSMLFLGAIIIAWGGWEIFQHNYNDGIGFLLAGLIWGLISYSFFKTINLVKVNLLLAFYGIAAIYAAIKLAQQKYLPVMDIFIVVVLFGFVLYGLIYLRKLRD